ncbi:TIGR04255 family protein [Candidatus Poribacteria bacterium]|nr:TIGR04255 family protein [Candidatus Poribacteria bacterium]
MPTKPLRLDNPPLVHVLAQVVSDPFLNISKCIAEMQEGLRLLGFVDIKLTQQPNVMIDPVEGQVSFGSISQWHFFTKDKRSSLVVSQNGFALQTNRYDHFAPFGELFASTASKLHLALPGGYKVRKRLGLRYANLILPEDRSVPPHVFVQPGLRGMTSNAVDSATASRRVETYFTKPDHGILAVRYMELPNQPLLPPGLEAFGMALPRVTWAGQRFGLLDLDRYSEQDVDFDLDDLLADLTTFNADIEVAFVEAVTEDAVMEWIRK